MKHNKNQTSSVPLPDGFLSDPVNLLALGFGAGCARYAPGTFGTLVGVIFFVFLAHLSLLWYCITVGVLFIMGIGICHYTAAALGVHDDQRIVWDEIVGYLITMIAVPLHWFWILLGFGLFRLFDITKPWPIRLLDREVGGGFGIMVDDVLAGLYAFATLHISRILIHNLSL